MPQNLENEKKYKKENNSEFRNSDITTFNMLLYTFPRFFPLYVLDNVSCELHIYNFKYKMTPYTCLVVTVSFKHRYFVRISHVIILL